MKCPGLLYSLSIYHLFSQPSIHQPKSPIHHDSPFLSLCAMVFFSGSLVLHVLHEEGRHGIGVQRVERPQHRRVAPAPLQAPELRQVAQRLRQAATVGPWALRAVGPGERPGGLPGDPPWELENSLGIMQNVGNVGNGKIEGIWSILLPNVWFYCICFHFKPSLMSLMLENGRKIIWLKGKKLEIYNQERAAKPGNSSLGSTIESLFAPTVLEHT